MNPAKDRGFLEDAGDEVFPGGVIPAPAPQSFREQSLRQVLRVSAGGDELRVRLSNLMGSAPMQIEGAHVAVAGSAPSAIDAATDTALAFGGQGRATIGAGQELWSDPVRFHSTARSNRAVTLYFGAETPVATVHSLVSAAHGAGKKVYLATLTPFKGVMAPYYDDAGESKREAVNAWIRNTAEVDGVIDFDAALRDPSDPLSMLTAYNSGDHLHPNDAGYAAMAGSIDLGLFR